MHLGYSVRQALVVPRQLALLTLLPGRSTAGSHLHTSPGESRVAAFVSSSFRGIGQALRGS